MSLTKADIEQLQPELAGKNPRTILKAALNHFDNIAISFSGAEDVVLIDLVHQLGKKITVFTLDTGRLHSDTYRFLEEVQKHYQIDLEVLSPDNLALEKMVAEKGLFSFYDEGHKECCGIRKIAPLRRKLATVEAWITGQRKDQSLDTRQNISEIEVDAAFSTDEHTLVKFNPLANWTSVQVWDYIEAYQVPYNPLHEQGFKSIGCEPCTRPTRPNQHEREGRWWWEDGGKKECGLHAKNS
ncbi:MAG: phosphoadenylyl-sulfate reductase [Gammaproteobacteria bacterium]|nr:MAG: phosphoadenylyl-sulfate reductase [Gammaproteobacteria bacterium]